jgi:hypothetical protein
MSLGKSSKLLVADPRDRPTDHETLDLRGPFEDRVDTGVTYMSPNQGISSRRLDPGISAK